MVLVMCLYVYEYFRWSSSLRVKVKNNENENTFFEIHYTLWLTTIQSQYLEYFEVVWPFKWNIPPEHE